MKSKLLCLAAVCALVSACKDEQVYETSGLIESTEVLVSSEGTGKLLRLDAEEGTILKKGEVVGAIDSEQLALEKRRTLSEIAELESSLPDIPVQLAPLREQLAKQRFEKNRFEGLVAAKSANRKQLDDINSDIEVITKKILALESDLRKTYGRIENAVATRRAQIAILDDKIAKCGIVNPIGGTVLVKYSQAGEIKTYGSPLYKIADLRTLFLRAYFTDAQLNKIKLGQKLKIRADFGADGSREYDGEVSWISAKAEFTPKGIRNRQERADLVYAVKLRVQNDGFLKIGQYAETEPLK